MLNCAGACRLEPGGLTARTLSVWSAASWRMPVLPRQLCPRLTTTRKQDTPTGPSLRGKGNNHLM